MLDVARDLRPDTVVQTGDLLDFYPLSRFSKDPRRALELDAEITTARGLIMELESLGASRYAYCMGNHEARLERYLREKAPELFDLLSVPDLLKLKGWEWYEYRDHFNIGSCYFTHDTGHHGRYMTYRSLDVYPGSVVTGHGHRFCFISEGNALGESKWALQPGWLGSLEQVEYAQRGVAAKNWTLGFAVLYHDRQTGSVWPTPVPIIDNRCSFAGKLYKAPRLRKGRR